MERLVDVLNEDKAVIETKGLDKVHAEGSLHRSIHVLVVNAAGKIYVRRRPADKPTYPDLWTSSVGTHVLHGMDPDRVAQTALWNFLGIADPVRRVDETRIRDDFENEIITVYTVDANSVPNLNPAESSDGTFMAADEIWELGTAHQTTPHLLGALAVYQQATGLNPTPRLGRSITQ